MTDVGLTTSEAPVPAGIDATRVTTWCQEHLPEVVPPLRFTLIAGGRSNLTFEVVDARGRRFALRRPPVSHVLPTAHDMAREHRLISSLAPTPVPVPATYGLCTDPSVNGAPFYVMEFVEGHILRQAADAEAAFGPRQRKVIGDSLADTLAVLHAVDPKAVGLGDLARSDGYVERQLRRWTRQYQSSTADAGVAPGGPDVVLEVGKRLAAGIPEQLGTSIVHGDYRLDNVVVDAAGSVRAILDWELSTLGDPLADLGLLLAYWTEPGESSGILDLSATALPGFPTRRAITDRYAAASGRDVSDVSFFVALGYWKLACVLQGVFARYQAGAGAGDPQGVDAMPDFVSQLAQRAATVLEQGL